MIVSNRISAGWSLAALAVVALLGGAAMAQSSFTPDTGSVGTEVVITGSGFGAGGKAMLVDSTTGATKPVTTALTVTSWTDTQIVADVNKAPKGGLKDYGVEVAPKGSAAAAIPGTFTLAPLSLSGVSPETGAVGSTIAINGNYFGSKKGKVSLLVSGPKGIVAKACKVATWTMNPATGASTATAALPKVPAGTYQLVVDNGLSNATWTNDITVTGP